MEFDLSPKLRLKNGISLGELGEELQYFTKSHLYIEDNKLKSVVDFSTLFYNVCRIVQIQNGYLLEEKEGLKRQIHVFSRPLMEYLTREIELGESSDWATTSSESEIYEHISTKHYVSEESESEIVYLRMMTKPDNDVDGVYATYVNPKIFRILEQENDINLEKTLIDSFSSFLEHRGYSPKVTLEYRCGVFGEIWIRSDSAIEEDLIDELEEEAFLLLGYTILYFYRIK